MLTNQIAYDAKMNKQKTSAKKNKPVKSAIKKTASKAIAARKRKPETAMLPSQSALPEGKINPETYRAVISEQGPLQVAQQQILKAIPQLDNELLEETILYCKRSYKSTWAIHAACALEILKRTPKLLGGSGRKDEKGEGREALIAGWAKDTGISPRNLRLSIKIVETFSTPSYERIGLTNPDHPHGYWPRDLVAHRWEQGIGATGFSTREGNTITHINMIEHPLLTRSHYVAALNAENPRAAIKDAIERRERGERYTARNLYEDVTRAEVGRMRAKVRSNGSVMKEGNRVKFEISLKMDDAIRAYQIKDAQRLPDISDALAAAVRFYLEHLSATEAMSSFIKKDYIERARAEIEKQLEDEIARLAELEVERGKWRDIFNGIEVRAEERRRIAREQEKHKE